ncbi:hypothetical protein MLD38_003953 [Melastoma candidum]|uniref:Uncharacterized protein n=1 Tax=Melastoma candidum TaxID=119954 RepID=A0ACB9SCN3_9MYRT|nr:hypothetical protein MLD38_003953 [Melastoma candidum]
MEVLPPLSCPSSNINSFQGLFLPSRWTPAENKLFENALAVYDVDTPDRWHRVASMIPGKSVEDVVLHYRDLELDVSKIEAGWFIPGDPRYPSPRPPPFTSGATTSYLCDGFKPSYNFLFGGKRSSSTRPLDHERKKGVPWTEEEHKLFLMGLKKYGKGDWRNISRNFVITKTPTQVASHAQKYFIRQLSVGKDKRRASIHDITTVNIGETVSPLPDNRRHHPSPDCPSYAMPLDQPNPASGTSSLWNQSKDRGRETFAEGDMLFSPPSLGAGSRKIKGEPHAHYYSHDDRAFSGIHNQVFQMQPGDCY